MDPLWTQGSGPLLRIRDQGPCLEGLSHLLQCTLCSPGSLFTLSSCSPSYWLWDKSALWLVPVKLTVTYKKVLFSCLLWAERELWLVFVQQGVGPPDLVWVISILLTPSSGSFYVPRFYIGNSKRLTFYLKNISALSPYLEPPWKNKLYCTLLAVSFDGKSLNNYEFNFFLCFCYLCFWCYCKRSHGRI